MTNRENYENGFTLIEILISAALLVMLGAGFLGVQYIFSQNQVTAWRNYANIEDSNLVVSKFTKEIRDARQSDEGSYSLDTVTDNEIIFYSDIDFDGDTERVRYTKSANQIIKGVIEPTTSPISYPLEDENEIILTEYVVNDTGPLFFYYNEDWPTDTVNNPLPLENRIADTKLVKIILKININPDDPVNEFTLESSGQIRMLKEY